MNSVGLPAPVGVRDASPRTAIRPMRTSDAAAWDDYVNGHPQATFFHRTGWSRVLVEVMRHRRHDLVAERDGRLAGVLPLVEVRSRLFGHSLTSLPFAVYGGFKLKPTVPGLSGKLYGPYAGLCLETQIWPDAINHPGFPNAVLRPGEVLRQETDYVFSKS